MCILRDTAHQEVGKLPSIYVPFEVPFQPSSNLKANCETTHCLYWIVISIPLPNWKCSFNFILFAHYNFINIWNSVYRLAIVVDFTCSTFRLIHIARLWKISIAFQSLSKMWRRYIFLEFQFWWRFSFIPNNGPRWRKEETHWSFKTKKSAVTLWRRYKERGTIFNTNVLFFELIA